MPGMRDPAVIRLAARSAPKAEPSQPHASSIGSVRIGTFASHRGRELDEGERSPSGRRKRLAVHQAARSGRR